MIPMEMTAPSQGMNSNILAGLTGDILKKVTKNITNTMSEHATQALQQGVPYGHILEQLIKMSPVSAGMAVGQDMVAGGGGGEPPDNGMSNNGGMKPPQPPQAGVKNNQDQSAVTASPDNATLVAPQDQTASNGQPIDANSILTQLLATMQKGNGQQVNMPSFLGIQPSAQNQLLLTEAAKNKQAMAGQTPMQIGDLQKIIAGVGGEQLSANTVPLNAAQREEVKYRNQQLAAGAATYQLENAKEQMAALNQEQERATSEFNAMVNSRGWISKGFTPKQAIDEYKSKLNDIGTRMDEARKNLVSLATSHPNLKTAKSAVAGTNSEPTATNPQTGKKVVYRNGQWQPLK